MAEVLICPVKVRLRCISTLCSIGLHIGEGRRSKPDLGVAGVIHAVEALQEREAVYASYHPRQQAPLHARRSCTTLTDEIQPLPAGTAQVGDNQINVALLAADSRVQRARPDLRVRRELVRDAADGKEQALQLAVLRRGEREQPRGVVERRARRALVRLEGVRGEQEERRARVDDAGGAGEHRRGLAVGQRLIDPPVGGGGRGGRYGHEVHLAGDPGFTA